MQMVGRYDLEVVDRPPFTPTDSPVQICAHAICLVDCLTGWLADHVLDCYTCPPPGHRFTERWEEKKAGASEEVRRVVTEEMEKLSSLEPVSDARDWCVGTPDCYWCVPGEGEGEAVRRP